MSEETTTVTAETDPATPAPAEPSAPAVGETPRKQRWLQRTTGGQTNLDRYVFPALVPLISVAIIIFYVINMSRVFLSGKGTIAIVAAIAITVAILVVSSAISYATRMRTQSIGILTAVALLAVAFGGWIAVGHAQQKKTAAVAACTPVTSKISVSAEPTLHFDKTQYTAKAGCVQITYGGASGHTLAFDPPGPQGPQLASAGTGGPGVFSWTLTPGNYVFYCTVPGHRAAGMQATLVVK